MRSRVIITGATGGLGKAFTLECARRGWDLFLTDIDGERLIKLSEAISRTYGVQIGWAAADLTKPSARESLFEQIQAAPYRFQALINVAGLDHEGIFLERSREQMRTIIDLNIEGTLAMTHAVLPQRDPGATFRIITVASLAAFFPMPVKATYAASKRFLVDFSLALREEVKPLGATVTVLCPAGLPTAASTIEAIEAQGFMGHLTTKNIGYVASSTIDQALKGKSIYIPGSINQALRILGGLLPARWISSFVGIRWRNAHTRRFSATDVSVQKQPAEATLKTIGSAAFSERAAA